MISSLFRMKAGVLVFLIALLLPSGALWAQDADLDPTFLTGAGFSGFAGSDVNAIVQQADGKIIVGGSFGDYNGNFVGRIARLNNDGSLDVSFNTGSGFSDVVKAIAIQSDGKIIVGGDFFGFNGATHNRLIRLNPDGSVDNTFSTSGEVGNVEAIVIQNDGKVVIAGGFGSMKIARLNSDGSLDNTFGTFVDFTVGIVYDLAIQSDGKILAVGLFSQLQGQPANNIVRLNTNGTQDATFATGTGFDAEPQAIALQADGKILVGGWFNQYNGAFANRIARLNSNGSLDNTFSTGSGFNGIVRDIKVQGDGKILVGGLDFTSYNGGGAIRIARLMTNGALDSSFNSGTGFDWLVLAMHIQTDGKILVGGQFTSYNGQFKPSLVRLKGTSAVGQPSCNAGLLPSDSTSLCASAFLTFDVVGTDIPEGYTYGLLLEPGLGASGGFGEASYITDVPLSLSFNGDLNGLFSGNGLAPLSGSWTITGVVYNDPNDVAGSVCATSNSLVVNYLDCDCQGIEGGTAFIDGCGTCVEGTTGLTACDQTCWQPLVSMLSPEAITYDYNNANLWGVPVGYHAPINAEAVAYADVVDGSNLACNASAVSLDGKIAVILRGGCAFSTKAYNAQLAGAVAVVVVNNQPGDEIFPMGSSVNAELVNIPVVMIGNNAGNALLSTIANGPVQMFIGNACVPGACDAGTLASPSSATLCPTDIYNFDASGVNVPDGFLYALFYQPGAGATGAAGNAFYITNTTPPFAFNSDINGVLSSNSLPPLLGSWTVSGVVYNDPADITGSICSSTAGASLTFLEEGTVECPVIPCEAGSIASSDDFAVCPGEFYSFEVIGQSVPLGATYAVLFEPGPTGTGALGGGFYINATSLPYVFDADINGILSLNALPPLQGEWTVTGVIYTDVSDIDNTVCSSTATSVTLNFLDAAAPACQPEQPGCTDSDAANYDPSANLDNGSCVYNVVFRVDMAQVTDPYTTPEVNGTFNGWCGGCAPMTNVGGSVWELTIALAPGTYEFKYAADAWNISEQLIPGTPCTITTNGFTNRILQVVDQGIDLGTVCWASCNACENPPVAYDVVFRVDMSQVTDPFTTPEVNGIFNGWCGGCAPMTNTGGDVWEITIALTPGLYEYKFAADGWNIQEQLTPGDFCTLTTGSFTNRLVEVIDQNIVLDIVCWGSCAACVLPEVGCTYPTASNYNPNALTDDGSCVFGGCTDPTANNYTPLATTDDGSCEFGNGSTCPGDFNGDGNVNVSDLSGFLGVFGSSCQ